MIQEIQTINWAEGSEPKVLNEIHRSTTNISIYNREISHLDVEINELLVENVEIQTSGEPKLIQQYHHPKQNRSCSKRTIGRIEICNTKVEPFSKVDRIQL